MRKNRYCVIGTAKASRQEVVILSDATEEEALRECEQWGWSYDDGEKSYWIEVRERSDRMRANDCIKAIAREQGMSMAQVARATNQSPQNLGQKLNRDSIRMNDVLRIAEALNMNVCLVSKDDPDNVWVI